jgi:hypothetical protein
MLVLLVNNNISKLNLNKTNTMKKTALLLIALTLLFATCGRQVPEGTTIKIVNETGYTVSEDIHNFSEQLREKLKKFNFTVKSGGTTDYTVKITYYDVSISSWTEYASSDDCNYPTTYTLESEDRTITADLYEYEASRLDGWTYTHSDSERLRQRIINSTGSDGCKNYVVVPRSLTLDLFEGEMKNFANRTARRVSRVVFRQ